MLLDMINEIIQLDGSPSDNVAILKRYTDRDEQLKLLIGMMYDPLVKFGIKVDYLDYDLNYFTMVENDNYNADKLMQLLTTLASGSIRGRKEKEALIWDYIEDNGEHLIMWLRGSLDLQIGLKTIQKLGIIENYSVQKGVLLKDFDKLSYPIVADWKYNGSRLTIQVEGQEKKVTCKLLKGRVIKIPLLEDIIRLRSPFTDYALDGELCFNGGVTEADRVVVSGLITSATSTNSNMSFTGLEFITYDILPLDKFKKCEVAKNLTFSKRRRTLTDLITKLDLPNQVSLTKAWEVTDSKGLAELLAKTKAQNGEGLMLKPYNSLYMHTKNNQWWKVKNMDECDLTIVGYKPHSRDIRLIGSLECVGYVDGVKVEVNTGSGLNDLDRPIEQYSKYHDKVVMVTYLDVIPHKRGTTSLSNPRFVKTDASDTLLSILRDGKEANNVNY